MSKGAGVDFYFFSQFSVPLFLFALEFLLFAGSLAFFVAEKQNVVDLTS